MRIALAVGDVLEQISLGPVRPQKLALLVAGTKPKAWSGHRLRSWLDAAAQVAVPFLEVLLVDEQVALEELRERSIENRVFGMA